VSRGSMGCDERKVEEGSNDFWRVRGGNPFPFIEVASGRISRERDNVHSGRSERVLNQKTTLAATHARGSLGRFHLTTPTRPAKEGVS